MLSCVRFQKIKTKNRNDDLIDEVIIASDPQNYSILKVTHNKNSNSEITFVTITPTGNTTISFDFCLVETHYV